VVEPEDLVASMPDRLIICPCGFTIEQTRADLASLTGERWWSMLPAVQEGNVVIVDGDAMFNRPGPRLADAFRWLVGWLNDRPDLIPEGFPVEPLEA
jgi:ABC-type Fe3+-hydroxamate transport system substrate-binding protein